MDPFMRPSTPGRQPQRRPSDNRQTHPPVSDSAPAQPQPVSTIRPDSQKPTKTPSKKPWLIIAIAAALLIVAAGAYVFMNKSGFDRTIDRDKYQAVFLTNGNIYFGKLHNVSGDHMKLTDVYYPQAQQSSNSTDESADDQSENQNNLQLIKLGEEIHGPEDEIFISKQHVLFYENLKPEARVVQVIKDHKASN